MPRRSSREGEAYPEIPDREYFTISEAGRLCLVEAHMLRHWEKEFPQLKAVSRKNDRRCYTQKDILLIRKIRDLLYEKRFTVPGARKELKQNGKGDATLPQPVDFKRLRKEIASVIRML